MPELNALAALVAAQGGTVERTAEGGDFHAVSAITVGDIAAANNIVLGTYRHITAPECRQFLLRQAFEEAIHTHAYQYIVESLGLDESEIFNAYHEVKSIRDKDEFLIPFIEAIMNPNFHTGTLQTDQTLLKSLIVFACLMEGLFFYVGFTQI